MDYKQVELFISKADPEVRKIIKYTGHIFFDKFIKTLNIIINELLKIVDENIPIFYIFIISSNLIK